METRGPFKNVTDEELRQLYIEQNLSAEEIAEVYGTSQGAVRTCLSGRGIKKGRELAQRCAERRNLEKLGVKSTSQLPEVRAKAKATMLERYGVDNVSKLPQTRAKAVQTWREKYGDKDSEEMAKINQKRKQTCLERYGAENAMKAKETQEKIKTTVQQRYGCDNPMQNPEIRARQLQKRAQNREKGVREILSLAEVSDEELRHLYIEENLSAEEIGVIFGRKASTIRTIMSRRGIHKDRALSEVIRARTSQEKWGTPYPIATTIVKEKIRQTCLERYGVPDAAHIPGSNERRRQTNLEKYGTTNPNQNLEIITKCVQARHGAQYPAEIMLYREKMEEYLCSLDKAYSIPEIADKLGVSYGACQHTLRKFGLASHPNVVFQPPFSKMEKEIVYWLRNEGVVVEENVKNLLPKGEVDMYLPDYKMAIEFDGNFWHGELRKPISFHQWKSLEGQRLGIFIYHVFEYEWSTPAARERLQAHLLSLLGIRQQQIRGEQCEIIKVELTETQTFLRDNSYWPLDVGPETWGLLFQGELIGVMTFKQSRRERGCSWEMVAYCEKRGLSIIGGAQQLFQHFRSFHKGNISTHSNFAKTPDDLYLMLGFSFVKISKAHYVWYKGTRAYTREEIKTKEGTTDIETLHTLKYHRIFDAGTKIWIHYNR